MEVTFLASVVRRERKWLLDWFGPDAWHRGPRPSWTAHAPDPSKTFPVFRAVQTSREQPED